MMLCGPGDREEILQSAVLLVVPAVKVTVLLQVNVVAPSRKLTVPVGAGSPVVPDTVAVKVSAVPKVEGLAPPVSVTAAVGVTLFTTCERPEEEAAL